MILWLLAFSIVPLAFVTGYSLANYNKAIDQELQRRIQGNHRELQVILSDFEKELMQKMKSRVNDKALAFNLSTGNIAAARNQASQWLQGDIAQRISIFNRDGRLEVSLFKDTQGSVRRQANLEGRDVYLSEAYMGISDEAKIDSLIDFVKSDSLDLIVFSEVRTTSNLRAGFIEEIMRLDSGFIQNLKNRLGLELAFISIDGEKVISSHEDLARYRTGFFKEKHQQLGEKIFELTIRGIPHGFVMSQLSWGKNRFYVAVGASKQAVQEVLRNVNFAFSIMVVAVGLLLIVLSFVISKILLQPVNQLVEFVQDMDFDEKPRELPIRSDNELGILAASFNEMAQRAYKSQMDLKDNIKKLELANLEIRDTQAKLVHSAKMVSLGQLVAGIAHELNNPISFIYSNMEHLRDYSKRLIRLVEVAESTPAQLKQQKEVVEFDYIVKDMPKLIKSCEDGALRTREIVLGLRNFSRLDEAKIKEVDIHEGIDSTLNLLAGELKSRIKVIKNYNQIPAIMCYPSQLNQVFMNILSNAIQSIKDQGEIQITTRVQGKDKVSVSFRDTGIGMTADVRERLFDPFFTTKDVNAGTGLGMSITYSIVQKHKGDISVNSAPGKGTEFLIVLPISLEK